MYLEISVVQYVSILIMWKRIILIFFLFFLIVYHVRISLFIFSHDIFSCLLLSSDFLPRCFSFFLMIKKQNEEDSFGRGPRTRYFETLCSIIAHIMPLLSSADSLLLRSMIFHPLSCIVMNDSDEWSLDSGILSSMMSLSFSLDLFYSTFHSPHLCACLRMESFMNLSISSHFLSFFSHLS